MVTFSDRKGDHPLYHYRYLGLRLTIAELP
jgi:hypothetical protein